MSLTAMDLTAADAMASILPLALLIYTLSGGADFGGGVWDLFARGPRKGAQRRAVAEAIGPIWEANHVWLIVVIVILFSAFPPAFALISTALHIPLTLMLIGIVLRGAAFTFHGYGMNRAEEARRWRRIFALSSTFTPITLGLCLGAVTAGTIRRNAEGVMTSGFVDPWMAPFPWAIGFLTLALFSYLAAIYLVVETRQTPELAEDFRRSALFSGVLLGALAWGSLLLAKTGAPRLHEGLTTSPWAAPLQAAIAASAVTALGALAWRHDQLARVAAIAQVTLMVTGWALAQYPYMVVPDLTLHEAAAEPAVLRLLLGILAGGSLVVAPAFYYLYATFKGRDREIANP